MRIPSSRTEGAELRLPHTRTLSPARRDKTTLGSVLVGSNATQRTRDPGRVLERERGVAARTRLGAPVDETFQHPREIGAERFGRSTDEMVTRTLVRPEQGPPVDRFGPHARPGPQRGVGIASAKPE